MGRGSLLPRRSSSPRLGVGGLPVHPKISHVAEGVLPVALKQVSLHNVRRLTTASSKHLSKYANPRTRIKVVQYIKTWYRYCQEENVHVLDASRPNCQRFVYWMEERFSPTQVVNRCKGVESWMDTLVREGVLRSHGMRQVVLPHRDKTVRPVDGLGHDDREKLVAALPDQGPRFEWLMLMILFTGVDSAEALSVRSTDVRTWNGRTLVRVRANQRATREVPVDGRLEVLTLGLAAVFAPTTTLAGYTDPELLRRKVRSFTLEVLGRSVSSREMRVGAIQRQYDRGVDLPVIAKWLGLKTVKPVMDALGISDGVDQVTDADVAESVVCEDDGDRFGSGLPADSLLQEGDDGPAGEPDGGDHPGVVDDVD